MKIGSGKTLTENIKFWEEYTMKNVMLNTIRTIAKSQPTVFGYLCGALKSNIDSELLGSYQYVK